MPPATALDHKTERNRRHLAAGWLAERLTHAELARLAHNGFVSGERLPSGNVAYKLRFRGDNMREHSRRQRVLYIGTNRQLAESIRAELERRQTPVRRRRKHRALAAQARTVLRAAKQKLGPALAARGIHFHGYDIRQRRPLKQP